MAFKPYWPTKFDTGFYHEGGAPDGFIVGRMHADAPIGIAYVTPNGLPTYAPCNRIMVMSAPAGKVIYFGSVHFAIGGRDDVTASYADDFAGAQAYMKAHYPELAARLEHGRAQFYPRSENC